MTAVASPIDLESIEDAIHAWFSGSTGLQVVWSGQNSPQPRSPYGVLNVLSGMQALSPVSEARDSTDLTRDAGEEIKIEHTVPCKFSVSCQTYVKNEDGQSPLSNAMLYANKAYMALDLSEYHQSLKDVNISVWDKSTIKNLNALVASRYESRAGFDLTFGTTMSLEEYTGYIERVQMAGTFVKEDGEELTETHWYGIGAGSVSKDIFVYDSESGDYAIDSESGNYVVR